MKSKTIDRSTILLIMSVNILITVGVVFILMFVLIPKVSAATGCFPDTNGHWAEEFICWMSDSGLTGGYPDGTYKPENNVTRAEMAVFMKNSSDLADSNDDDTLGSLSCSTDQIAKWNGSAWECQEDLSGSGSDTLDSLSCSTYDIARWNGSAWECDSALSDLVTLLASIHLENGGQDFVFTGVNVHVRDGSGDTDGTVNGRGNLIVGYNEDEGDDEIRTGSHNLVLGTENDYTSFGGLVAGKENTISGVYAVVSGGDDNTATGSYSSISGGNHNTASGTNSSVSGGYNNTASGEDSSISGGGYCTASGLRSSNSGGRNNTASGSYSSVNGGRYNIASGDLASVLGGGGNTVGEGNEAWAHYSIIAGGQGNIAGDDSGTDRLAGEASAVLAGLFNTASEDLSVVVGGRYNESSGWYSSVSGGYSNIASGYDSSVSGGNNNTASGTYSSVSGGNARSVSGIYDWRAGDLFETD